MYLYDIYVPRPAWDLVQENYYILVLESHLDIPCACILAMQAIQVSKSPFWAVQNLVLQFTFFYFNLLSFTLIYFLSLLFSFYLWNYFKLLLFTFIYLTLYSNSNFLQIYRCVLRLRNSTWFSVTLLVFDLGEIGEIYVTNRGTKWNSNWKNREHGRKIVPKVDVPEPSGPFLTDTLQLISGYFRIGI